LRVILAQLIIKLYSLTGKHLKFNFILIKGEKLLVLENHINLGLNADKKINLILNYFKKSQSFYYFWFSFVTDLLYKLFFLTLTKFIEFLKKK